MIFFFFSLFFSEEKIACYIERSHFIFLDSRINFSICCENCHVCLAAILKKEAGRLFWKMCPAAILKRKKKRLLLPFFHRGRTLNMFLFFYFA